MQTSLKFEKTLRRIEMMMLEIKLIEIEANDIIEEAQDFHQRNFAEFDVLDADVRMAERSASDRVSHARSLRGAIRQLNRNFESEIRHLRESNPFEIGGTNP